MQIAMMRRVVMRRLMREEPRRDQAACAAAEAFGFSCPRRRSWIMAEIAIGLGYLLLGELSGLGAGFDHFLRFAAVKAMLVERHWPAPGALLAIASIFRDCCWPLPDPRHPAPAGGARIGGLHCRGDAAAARLLAFRGAAARWHTVRLHREFRGARRPVAGLRPERLVKTMLARYSKIVMTLGLALFAFVVASATSPTTTRTIPSYSTSSAWTRHSRAGCDVPGDHSALGLDRRLLVDHHRRSANLRPLRPSRLAHIPPTTKRRRSQPLQGMLHLAALSGSWSGSWASWSSAASGPDVAVRNLERPGGCVRFYMTILLVLIYVMQPDAEIAAGR